MRFAYRSLLFVLVSSLLSAQDSLPGAAAAADSHAPASGGGVSPLGVYRAPDASMPGLRDFKSQGAIPSSGVWDSARLALPFSRPASLGGAPVVSGMPLAFAPEPQQGPGGPAGDMAAVAEAPAPAPRAPRPPRPAPPEERQPSSNASTIMIEGGEDFEDDDGPPVEEGEEINYNRADGVPVTTAGERRPSGPGGAGGPGGGPGGQQRRRRRRGRRPGGPGGGSGGRSN